MKNIPILLQSHLKQFATTWCYLMRVECVGKYAGVVRGFTSLDMSLTYDDGDGPVLYKSDNGFTPSAFQRAADFSVANGEAVGYVTDNEITESDILAGIFSFARFAIYRVNYNNLAQGHEVVESGTFGETKFNENRWRVETRSLMQQARQPFGEVFSLTCRARYGDEKCKKPFEWFEGSVAATGTSNMIEFFAEGLAQGDDYFAPGVIEWLTGRNAGADMDVDDYAADGFIRLALQMPMPIEAGDTFRIRIDCPKTFEACKERNNVLEFRGEHLTPVADTGLQIPGAYTT